MSVQYPTQLLPLALFAASVFAAPTPCSPQPVETNPDPAALEVAAVLGGQLISTAEVDAWWKVKDPSSFARVQQELFLARERALNDLILQRRLEDVAATRGFADVSQLIDAELPRYRRSIEPEEVSDFLVSNSAKLATLSPSEARGFALKHLQTQEEKSARARALDALQGESRLSASVRLAFPRTVISVPGDAPVRREGTAIRIIEFGDFECRFCQQLQPTLRHLASKYPGMIERTWIDFPLANHAGGQRAAIAAQCAREQGVFWEYHDLLFSGAVLLQNESLTGAAVELGVDAQMFRQCLTLDETRARVNAGIAEGRRVGVVSTPTLFVNGQMITGMRTLAEYQQIIDAELRRMTQLNVTTARVEGASR